VTERHWANISEVTSVAGIKLLFLVHRLFGRWPFRVFVYPAILFHILRHPLARRSSQVYLTRVFRSINPAHPQATLWQSVQHFGAFAENILDKLRIWAGELKASDVEFHDYHIINDQVLAGRGGLIFVTHLGNVEVTRALPTRKNGVRLTVLVHTKHAETFNALLAEFDPASTTNILQVTEISADTVTGVNTLSSRPIACPSPTGLEWPPPTFLAHPPVFLSDHTSWPVCCSARLIFCSASLNRASTTCILNTSTSGSCCHAPLGMPPCGNSLPSLPDG
jgi:hypothetical protein